MPIKSKIPALSTSALPTSRVAGINKAIKPPKKYSEPIAKKISPIIIKVLLL